MKVEKYLKESSDDVIARKVFVTLVKLYPRGYSILNDGYFVKKIYAASDEEAIRQFNELATKGQLLTECLKKRTLKESTKEVKPIKTVLETKQISLVESVMSDIDLEVKEAGGKEAFIANISEQIDDLSHYLNYLKKNAYNEVNRGGNFESANEVDEAIKDCEKQLSLLKSKKALIDERKDKSLKEDLTVAVNGEEVPVDAVDVPVAEPVVVEVDAEKQPIEEVQETISIEQVLSDLIKDEFEAIDGYNSALATLKILENDGSDYSGIIANLEDIKNEELVHVGQLQKCLAEVNPKAEAIDDGKDEASETIATAEEKTIEDEEPVVEA